MPETTERAMRWASALSRQGEAAAAVDEVARALEDALGAEPPDLALVFLSAHHVTAAEAIAGALRERLKPGCLAGSSAHGVVSSEHEIEGEPALVVSAARLPGVEIEAFLVLPPGPEGGSLETDAFQRFVERAAGAELVLLLGDPFTMDLEQVLVSFERAARGVRLVGGLASASPRPGGNAVLLNDWVGREGGLLLALSGALRADVVVSQGCRAIGPPLEITKGEENVIAELDGMPALERAEQVLRALPESERARLDRGLYVGLPAKRDAEGRGDYVIRALLGADRDRGLLAVGDRVLEGQRVRLHVRDAETAREDLAMLLSPQGFDTRAEAALLFACNGRGRGLYGAPDGDIGPLQSALGGVPVAGMFCAGEVGPVGERSFLHGHTASIAIIRRRPAPAA